MKMIRFKLTKSNYFENYCKSLNSKDQDLETHRSLAVATKWKKKWKA